MYLWKIEFGIRLVWIVAIAATGRKQGFKIRKFLLEFSLESQLAQMEGVDNEIFSRFERPHEGYKEELDQ